MDVSLGVIARQRHQLQLRLQRLVHRGATARGGHRIQLPARGGVHGTWDRRLNDETRRGACRRHRGHDRNRLGHVHAREAGHERVRTRGRRRLSHLFHLCARTGRAMGHVPVARPRPQGAQRDGHMVPPPRRVRQALSQVVNVVGASEKLEGITEDIQKVKAKRTSHLFCKKYARVSSSNTLHYILTANLLPPPIIGVREFNGV